MNTPLPVETPVTTGKLFTRCCLPLHVFLTVLFGLVIFVSGITIATVNYWQTRQAMLSIARQAFVSTGSDTEDQLIRFQTPVVEAVSYLSRSVLVKDEKLERRLPIMAEVLIQNPAVEAVFAGYSNGDFFILTPVKEAYTQHTQVKAPANAHYMVRSVEYDPGTQQRKSHILFLDQNLQTLGTKVLENFDLDPRQRPWYQGAQKRKSAIITAPYIFTITGKIGESIARQDREQHVVAGADIALEKLVSQLRKALAIIPAASAELMLFDGEGKLIADSRTEEIVHKTPEGNLRRVSLGDMDNPVTKQLDSLFHSRQFGSPQSVDVNGSPWLILIREINRGEGNPPLYLAVAAPEAELLAEALTQLKLGIFLTALVLLLTLPVTWYASRRVSQNLHTLIDEAQAIQHFNFSPKAPTNSMIREVHELSEATGHARRTIRHFLDISSTLSAERNFSLLIGHVLQETLDIVEARVGIMYLMNDDGDMLVPEAVRHISENEDQKHRPDNRRVSELSTIPVSADSVDPIAECVATGQTIVVNLVPSALGKGLQELLEGKYYRLIAVPLKKRTGEITGVMCMFRGDAGATPSYDLISFVEQLSGGAAISIENQRLLLSQRALLDGLIQLIASAIDSKSHYTGSHCQRVPELTRMLAEAACADKTGPFAGFDLDEDGWEALRIGTWLHDCGKVTTPEHVVDKATKLETIYDRIHEVRMRFEVLKRDTEIAYWQALGQGVEEPEARARRNQDWQQLDDDFNFIAECNEGGEFMAPEKLERLYSIAQQTWNRTLSDRIGISWSDKARKNLTPEPELPVEETLLADKPEHLIEHGPDAPMLTDNSWGFWVTPPPHAYNHGELHNLSIKRGTLTAEERYKINDHIVQTILMLSCLPFPPHLSQVAEIAGGHHERVDGKGYPKGLKREEMSTEARMVAIADIFEALTAVDRPYKKSKTLSEALQIMATMKQNHHIDPDLFDLFLRSGVYLEYANRYLSADQIDEVDIGRLL
ncbi:MAG: HD domain-containing phosphohydrolase [Azovibrio sp.]